MIPSDLFAALCERHAAAEQVHPIRFEVFDIAPAHLPVGRNDLPPILQNVLGEIEDEHPEIHDLLAGTLTFDDALRAGV